MNRFEDWRGRYAGEDCLVVAPGQSSKNDDMVEAYGSRWVIGCNSAVDYCKPDFAVCVERPNDPLWPMIYGSQARAVFTKYYGNTRHEKRLDHPKIVDIPSRNMCKWFDELPHRTPIPCTMSPMWAVAVAAYLGFETVGLVGVDLTPERFARIVRPNMVWKEVAGYLPTIILNLSTGSRLTSVPQGSVGQVRKKGVEVRV